MVFSPRDHSAKPGNVNLPRRTQYKICPHAYSNLHADADADRYPHAYLHARAYPHARSQAYAYPHAHARRPVLDGGQGPHRRLGDR